MKPLLLILCLAMAGCITIEHQAQIAPKEMQPWYIYGGKEKQGKSLTEVITDEKTKPIVLTYCGL